MRRRDKKNIIELVLLGLGFLILCVIQGLLNSLK